jgi:hypothetical protein
MAAKTSEITPFATPQFNLPVTTQLPTTPPFSFHVPGNNNVTLILAQNSCRNKQVTFQRPSKIPRFAPKMKKHSAHPQPVLINSEAGGISLFGPNFPSAPYPAL